MSNHLFDMNSIAYYENVKQETEYAKCIYTNKTIENTLEHAEQDGNNADEHLKRAKEFKDNKDPLEFERACRSATKDSVDSIEKYLKVIANMKGIQENTFINNNGREEKIQKTHSISGINNAINSNFLSSEEAKFMDKFTDEENQCFSSHTGLAYGNVTPTCEEAERAVRNKCEVEKKVQEFRERVLVHKFLNDISFS